MNTRNIAIDLGFGFVKATDGESDFIFPSVVGAAQELTYRSELTTYVESIENLAVTIDGKRYFVGDLAIRQSEILSRSMSDNHAQEKNTKVLFLTILALFVQVEHEEFNVVTGLPPGYYLANKDLLFDLIKGTHTVYLNIDGTDQKKVIVVNKVKTIPQPLGTLFGKIFDEKGVIKDKELARSKVGIIDIGFRTTDFAVVDKLEYIDRLSYTKTTAMSNVYAIISEYLHNKFRIYKEDYDLEDIVQRAQIKVDGDIYTLEQIKTEAYGELTAKILTEMNSIWDKRMLDVILISGGGGSALAEFLIPELKIASLVEDSQTANVHGYLKLGHKIFGYTDNRQRLAALNSVYTTSED
jgi:plasmid segregation protein ParM